MGRIVTFLGQQGSGHTVAAIAAAKWFAAQGKTVLLVTHVPSTTVERELDVALGSQPQLIATGLYAVKLKATDLLEQGWAQLQPLVTPYLPNDFSDKIYPGELMIVPGFDNLLTLNFLREHFTGGKYDVIVYDGRGDLDSLRMLGMPEMLNWYWRRFSRAVESLDLAKIADSLGGPIASAILAANIDSQKIKQGISQLQDWIGQSLAVIGDSRQLTAYLVTTPDPAAIAEAQWLWGSSQQVNLNVSGVIVSRCESVSDRARLEHSFSPLPISLLPPLASSDWQSLLDALPNFHELPAVPPPLTIDLAQRQIQVFLPGFTKAEVKLTPYGTDLTVEAGDQRRNIALPEEWQGQAVKTGKFEAPYLVISF